MKQNENLRIIIIAALCALLAGAALANWNPGDFMTGWLDGFVLSFPFFILLFILWRWAGGGKQLAIMILLAFGLRFGFGLAAQNLLPVFGYPDEHRQQLGYLFEDAWQRDEESWRIATQEEPSFFEPLIRSYNNDQYGGMAVLSIWIYRFVSPDARRFGLIYMLGALFSAAGVPFLWKALHKRWGRLIATTACWIYVLYPDSVFYAGAAMREPFLTGIVTAAFWALCTLRDHLKQSAIALTFLVLLCLPFSSMVGGALLAVIALWIWVEFLIPQNRKWLWAGVGVMVLSLLVLLAFALPFIEEFVHFDIHTTENSSGWVEKVVGEIGGQFRSLFLMVYGITQPVLPAILVYPTKLFWKVAGIFRAAGWYLMVPFLFYALFSTLLNKDKKDRTLLVANAAFVVLWILVSSFRAGGDQWDNPRYRVIFLPWMAFFCAWGISYAIRMRDWWLLRWILIEIIFLVFFTQWYYSRYSGDAIRRYPFWKTVTYILIGSGAVFITGLIGPIKRKLSKSKEE